MSDTRTRIGYVSNTPHGVSLNKQYVKGFGYGSDTAGHDEDTTKTRLGHGEQILWAFSFFGLKKTLI